MQNKETNRKRIVKKKKLKKNNSFKIAAVLATVALLLLCYMTFGIEMTILIAAFIGIIIGIGLLLGKMKNKKKQRKVVSLLLIMFLSIGIVALCGFCIFMIYIKIEADPKYKNAKLNTLEVSRIYDKDGKEFAKIGSENREKVKYEQLPEVLVDAIIATEDARFYQHNGFDTPRFIKASIGQIMGHSDAGGASTLTMQVVKNSFTDKYGEKKSGASGITRKFEDIYLAIFKLEREYSKEEIIEFYVNNHFLGGNIYGVQEASESYFGKDVSDLNLSEASILAGMFKSPNAFKPTANPENAAKRRKTVLYLMRRHGYITEEEEEIANSIPIESLTSNAQKESENPYQGYIDTVVDELKETYGVNPYTTPLLVYTNLDRDKQNGVNSVLAGENFDWKDDRVQAGVAVLDSETGKILAIGNGRNVNSRSNSNADQYNYATEIHRQPGSTAKPLFDYGPGIEYNNWSTYEQFVDEPYTYSSGRKINNWDRQYHGQMSLRTALKDSRNIPALKAFQQNDKTKVRDFVTSLGITPEVCNSGYKYDVDKKNCYNPKNKNDVTDPIDLHEAHAIGAFTGVSPLEMAGAYAAFSNGGYYNKPYAVEKVKFRQSGREETHKSDKKQVMSDATAYMIASVLQDVALYDGTPNNVACKTGTTNFDANTMENYGMPDDAVRDSWVIGFSTKTVIGMWYGYDAQTKELIQQGYVLHNIPATMAKDRLFRALVFAGAMESDRSEFVMPSSVVKIGIAPGSNPPKLAAPGGGAVYELFKKGHEPTEYDTTSYKIPAPSGFSVKESGGKAILSWNAVNPGELGKDEYGKFGYNVYKDGVLLEWTDKTSYTYNPSSGSIYGTYKVVATYKSYSGLQSDAATAKLEARKTDPTPTTTPSPTPTTTTTPEPSPTPTVVPGPTTTTEP